ncbi:hypothetical protein L486_05053 [Kwoniella mangroviensis CBS 10435]|uniref:Uncharacterized protein n=1 Tax=Kwoniella mangroviensis CBS 10435 TaxID=1331196 RepID=A0A1B9IQB1_9TREE|nr:hypothetical protein L486_05053 [Kwoniella mangroviensis CBS 10435]
MHFSNSRHRPPPLPLPVPSSERFYPSSTDNLLPVNDPFYPAERFSTPDPTSNGLVRRKSILKMPKVDITWDDTTRPQTPTPNRPITPISNPRKLQKHYKPEAQPIKGVRFTASTQGEGFSHGLPTPDPTPGKGKEMKVKKKPSWIHWPFTSHNQNTSGSYRDVSKENRLPTLRDTPSPTGSDCSWHHHSSYFPEYTPIYPKSPFTITPSLYPLTAAELQAQEHSSRVGHSVVVHYPMLPSWNEYSGGQQDKAKAGWQSSTNGLMNGWNGYGWTGDNLPKANELTFGKPAPAGEPLEGAKKKKKKKKKKGGQGGGGGGGGGAGEEGGDDDEEGGEGEGGDEEGG